MEQDQTKKPKEKSMAKSIGKGFMKGVLNVGKGVMKIGEGMMEAMDDEAPKKKKSKKRIKKRK